MNRCPPPLLLGACETGDWIPAGHPTCAVDPYRPEELHWWAEVWSLSASPVPRLWQTAFTQRRQIERLQGELAAALALLAHEREKP